MARLDKFHPHVREALLNAKWSITHDPYVLKLANKKGIKRNYPIDLVAEKLIAAQKDKFLIAVEVKTFGGSSVMHDFHEALGQYMDYLVGLKVQEPERKLYVAVTEKAHKEIVDNPLAALSVEHYMISFLIFNPLTKTIVKWIN